jgi:hypothetical protein
MGENGRIEEHSMNEQTINWLRETFGAALTIHTDEETGDRFLYWREVMDLVMARPLDSDQVTIQLWQQPGVQSWLVFREEDLPYLDAAIHDAYRQRN